MKSVLILLCEPDTDNPLQAYFFLKSSLCYCLVTERFLLPSSCFFSFLKSSMRSSNLTWEARKKSWGSGRGKILLSVPAS